MKVLCAAGILAVLDLIALPASAAHHPIAISDSLAANADQLSVKEGSQWFREIPKWSIGGYAVISSRLGSTRIESKTNFLKTKMERHSTTRFSFLMCDNDTTSDTVSVAVVRHAMDESTHGFKLNKHVSLGSDEVVQESDSCTALITVKGDTSATWTLLKTSISAPALEWEALLTNGTRRVVLAFVTSIAKSDTTRRGFFSQLKRQVAPPSIGYEFVEDGRSIGALQTFGGMSTKDRRRVWLHRGLDANTKLVLVAAMTTILQVESSATGLEPPEDE